MNKMDRSKHISFWLRHLRMLPTPYQSADTQRMTIGYFCLSALDLLGAVESDVPAGERAKLADWIYEQQLPTAQGGGFRGSPSAGPVVRHTASQDPSSSSPSTSSASAGAFTTGTLGHLAMTYTALLSLAILRDDFARLDRAGLRALLRASQNSDGSFNAGPDQLECDVRFTFCAFAVARMADCWDAVDVQQALHFLARCRNYDGGYAQAPKQESHGGSTYCVLAALTLAGRLDALAHPASLRSWLSARQQPNSGFNGRSEKPVDTCYSFWCGASLAMIGSHDVIDRKADVGWILSNQSVIGGFAKAEGERPDAMHSYMGTAALALHSYELSRTTGDDAPALIRLGELLPQFNVRRESLAWLDEKMRSTRPKAIDSS